MPVTDARMPTPAPPMNGPMAKMLRPAARPSTQVAAARAATARRGIARASPQKVTGPPAAAANSSVAAGASPIPTSSSAATNGISNISGTFISRPRVAAIATPWGLLPK